MRFPLRAKFFVFATLLALVPLGLVGFNLIQIARDELKSAANEELTTVADHFARDIDDTILGYYLAPLLVIRNGVDSPDLGVPQKISLLTLGISEMPDVKALQLTIAGSDLPVLITDQDYVARLAAAGIADPNAALRTGVAELQTIAREGRFGEPVITQMPGTNDWFGTIALPLNTPLSGRPVILSARVDMTTILTLRARNPFQARGEINLVNVAGDAQLVEGNPNLSGRDSVAQAMPLIEGNARALALRPYTRADGTAMLSAYAFPSSIPWAVVTELSEESAYAVVDQMTRTIAIVAGLGFVVAAIGALIFAQGLTQPILRIGAAAKAVGQGDFSARVKVGKRSRDEIGDLATRFNAMIGELNERMELMKFVSQGTVDAIKRADAQGISRGGARRELAVLFTDIRGYTEFSESVPPEVVVEMLNLYLDTQTEIVKAHGGDIDKFIGDALVAVFDGDGMERRAVQSGLEIQVAMLRLLSERPDWNLQIGIGIASGEVVLGAMGARDRMDFTVLGSTVNLSARLCSKAPAGDVLVNTSVRDKAVADGALAVFEPLDPIALKGYAEPVAAFSVKASEVVSGAAE